MTLQTSMHSSAGLIWDSRSNAAVPSNLNFLDVAYGNGIYLAGRMYNCGSIATISSSDAINWTSRTGTYFDTLVFGNGKFVAVSVNGGANQVMISG